MFDYSFFAMLFMIASSLAPAGATEFSLINAAHPGQEIHWTRDSQGGYSMEVNHRPIGRFERVGDEILHHVDRPEPTRFSLSELVADSSIARRTAPIRLGSRFEGVTINVEAQGSEFRLRDRGRTVLRSILRLTHGVAARPQRAPTSPTRPLQSTP